MNRILIIVMISAAMLLAAAAGAAEKAVEGADSPAAELGNQTAFEDGFLLPMFENETEVVVFLIDTTESMALPFGNTTRLAYVTGEMKSVISGFSGNVKVGIVFFSSAATCKHSGAGKEEILEEVERKMGT